MDTSVRREAMKLIILGLERSGVYSRWLKGYINEIIEFGTVKVDEILAVVDAFHTFIRPQVDKEVGGKIRIPTRLSNEDPVDGMLSIQVVSWLKK